VRFVNVRYVFGQPDSGLFVDRRKGLSDLLIPARLRKGGDAFTAARDVLFRRWPTVSGAIGEAQKRRDGFSD
jgi:hypothetical protein